MLAVANYKDYMFLKKWSSLIYWASVVLVYLTPFIGQERLGATRWIFIGPVSIQPTEIMKIALIIYLADVLSSEKKRNTKRMSLLQRFLYEWREEIIIVIPAAGAAMRSTYPRAHHLCDRVYDALCARNEKKPHRYDYHCRHFSGNWPSSQKSRSEWRESLAICTRKTTHWATAGRY